MSSDHRLSWGRNLTAAARLNGVHAAGPYPICIRYSMGLPECGCRGASQSALLPTDRVWRDSVSAPVEDRSRRPQEGAQRRHGRRGQHPDHRSGFQVVRPRRGHSPREEQRFAVALLDKRERAVHRTSCH